MAKLQLDCLLPWLQSFNNELGFMFCCLADLPVFNSSTTNESGRPLTNALSSDVGAAIWKTKEKSNHTARWSRLSLWGRTKLQTTREHHIVVTDTLYFQTPVTWLNWYIHSQRLSLTPTPVTQTANPCPHCHLQWHDYFSRVTTASGVDHPIDSAKVHGFFQVDKLWPNIQNTDQSLLRDRTPWKKLLDKRLPRRSSGCM